MIGENIKKHRKRNKLSLRELAQRLEVSHTAIDKYEKNILVPSSTHLIKMTKLFDIKVADLFRVNQNELVIEDIHYRKKSNFTKSDQTIVEDITRDRLQNFIEVINLFPDTRYKKLDLGEFKFQIDKLEDIEDAVLSLRTKLNLGIDPISNLLEVLEELGIIIVFIEPVKGFDGKEGLVNNMPFIVLSNEKPGDRQRNSLAHELGHLLVQHKSFDDEVVANYFAGAFLIPKAALINDIGTERNKLSFFELINLKKKYKVSMQSIIFRAWQLKIISELEKRRLFIWFSSNGYRRNEPIEIAREVSTKFERMLCEAVTEGYISESKAADYLGIKTIEFSEKYIG